MNTTVNRSEADLAEANKPVFLEREFELINTQEYQESLANRVVRDVFGSKENSKCTAVTIRDFVNSYSQHKDSMALESWLIHEFRKHPGVWTSETDLQNSARDITANVEQRNVIQRDLQQHLNKGMSQESWLAKKIEEGTRASGAASISAYVSDIDLTLETATRDNWNVIHNFDGSINQSRNLDGFIAERHHADTFNIDAASKGSKLRAEVLSPEPGQAYSKNSVDIVIKDGNGKIVRRYQSKYGKDADTTSKLFDKGDYRGQQKLVPKGQSSSIEQKNTEVIEAEGVSSTPLSKEEAKALQEKAQLEHETKKYDWDSANRIEIAKCISKQALLSAGISACFHGVRILGRRIWNTLTGQENQSSNQDMQEFFNSSLKSGADVGLQTAVSGGLMVACRNGWLGETLKTTPAGKIAQIAVIGMESAKAMFKFAKNEISGHEAIDYCGRSGAITIASFCGASKGAALSAAFGSVIGPIGTVVGGFVGGVVGGIAGSTFGEAVYEGSKAIAKTGANFVKSVVGSVNNAAKNAVTSVANVGRRICDSITNIFS
ncbi:hypothetical protein [Shewanella algae]|uniref:hypothetical protein n=1 Tax=Shewanella algae TaxID=38313 RepID=UPI001184434A|nr:hypothetical protein [Shewanella algae]TVP06933.1 hypothetical protein AYI73_08145 [Shewanella algae]BCV39501.1 hypothetical protein TUM17378_07630 [Shewanella algae]